MSYRTIHTDEARNISFAGEGRVDLELLMQHEATGPWWDLLRQLGVSLAVSREYEHFILFLGCDQRGPRATALEIPHPSGMAYDEVRDELLVSSTRTPHQLLFFKAVREADFESEIIPGDFERPQGTVYFPHRSLFLPGDLYIHDVALIDGEIHVTVTGHNFVATVARDGGWERVWWPACVDELAGDAFNQNYLQLNSMSRGEGVAGNGSYLTAFSDETSGPKPWKEGYGPRGRGVVFSGATREVVCRGLTCPHSARGNDGRIWLCNSGHGQLGTLESSKQGAIEFEAVAEVPGFTRGLAFSGQYAFVGLSRVIDTYEPYAPGLDAAESVCGIAAIDMASGRQAAQLTWPNGYQIYDIQVLPQADALLPTKPAEAEFNLYLRYLG